MHNVGFHSQNVHKSTVNISRSVLRKGENENAAATQSPHLMIELSVCLPYMGEGQALSASIL
jgi:hypothetical protein